MLMEREWLTIERIVGAISLAIFIRTVVGIGSRSKDELDDWDSKCVIYRWVAGVNEVGEGSVRVVNGRQGRKRVGLKVKGNFFNFAEN